VLNLVNAAKWDRLRSGRRTNEQRSVTGPSLLGVAKRLVAVLLCAFGAPAIARRVNRRHLSILMFHGVESEPVSPPCDYVLDVATLRRELGYIRDKFHVLPLQEALERLYSGTLPKRAATITFDDGTMNLLTHAAPVLGELELPAAVFLATGLMGTEKALWADALWLAFAQTSAETLDLAPLGLGDVALASAAQRGAACSKAVEHLKVLPDDERLAAVDSLIGQLNPHSSDPGPFRLLSWDQARLLAADGSVTLHPHSSTHPILSQCSDEKVLHEVTQSCADIEREIGSAPTVFAYPNGELRDFDERCRAALRGRGIRWALATTHGFAHRDSDPLAIPRVGIASSLSFPSFKLVASGLG